MNGLSSWHRRLVLAALVFATVPVAWAQPRSVEITRATKPSVVIVGMFNAATAPRFSFRGTGFAIGDGRMVVTNAHVLVPPEQLPFGARIEVRLPGTGGELEARAATVVAVDASRDLALLSIEGAALPALRLAGPEWAAEGQPVLFYGFPIGGVLGYATVVHRGMLSSITQAAIPSPSASRLTAAAAVQLREGSFTLYQLDGTAYPGNSGGPVLDAETGQVIAVINMVLVKGTREAALTNPSGIAYAVPVRFVHELLARR